MLCRGVFNGPYICIASVLPKLFFLNHRAIARSFTLGKTERLKSRKLIDQLFRGGRSFAVTPFKIFYSWELTQGGPVTSTLLFGVGAGTRNFKRAVDRNRIKRLTREAYRLQKNTLFAAADEKKRRLALFLIYTGRELPDYKTVSEKMGLILQRLVKELQTLESKAE